MVTASVARASLKSRTRAGIGNALELLAWMIGRGHLEVKVAVPCDKKKRPVSDTAIFHEKSGIIEDRTGHKIAWTGSLNETAAGWKHNWESINVYRSWGPEPKRVASEERNFARLWADQSARAIVLNVPDAARRDLLRFMPEDGASGTPEGDDATGAQTRRKD